MVLLLLGEVSEAASILTRLSELQQPDHEETPMLKKIVLVALFVVSAAVGATGTVLAHAAPKAPLHPIAHGLCVPWPMPGC